MSVSVMRGGTEVKDEENSKGESVMGWVMRKDWRFGS